MTREEQILALVPFAKQKTKQVMSRRNLPWSYYDDALADGLLGLIKAVDRHNADLGPIEPYADGCIEGGILDGVRSWTGIRTALVDGERVEIRNTRSIVRTRSLDEPVKGELLPADVLAQEIDDIKRAEDRIVVERVLSRLSTDQQRLLVEHYMRERSIRTMAQDRGLSWYRMEQQLDEALRAAKRLAGATRALV